MIECEKCKDWFHGRYVHMLVLFNQKCNALFESYGGQLTRATKILNYKDIKILKIVLIQPGNDQYRIHCRYLSHSLSHFVG